MAYASKSEKRLAGSMNYGSSAGTLTSSSVKGMKDMGNNGPSKLMGKMSFGGEGKKLYGNFAKSTQSSSGVSGEMGSDGYPKGVRQARLTEPGNLEPGKRSQAKNTTRIDPDADTEHAKPQYRSATSKALRGGK